MKTQFKLGLTIILTVGIMMAIVACTSPAPIFDKDKSFTYESIPDDKDNFSFAKFSIWCPENVKTYKGILYLGAGYEYSSIPMMEEEKWRNLARENEFIILSSHMRSRVEEDTEIAYWQAECGSGQEMLNALEYFAKESEHSEIEFAPLAMWGFSAGAQFNYQFACWKPERVITFVGVKGGYYFATPNKEALKIPGLFFSGENDLQRRKDAVNDLFKKYEKAQPLWCLANEAKFEHEIGETDKLAIPWLKEVIKQRLPKNADPSKGPIKLKDIDQSLAWLGDRTNNEIVAIKDYHNNQNNSSWLPNETVAQIWKGFHLPD